MFKIHTRDGQTARVDLTDEEQAKMWLQRLKDPSFQKSITAISIVQHCNGRFKCPNCKRVSHLQCSNCGHPSDKVHCGTGMQYTIARPVGLDGNFYHIEHVKPDAEKKIKGGEKMTCFSGDVRLTTMVHASQPSSKISLVKVGKQRFNPFQNEGN